MDRLHDPVKLAIWLLLLMRSQYWSPEKQRAFQWRQIHRLVIHAYSYVDIYREKYGKAGFDKREFNSLEYFRKLPVVTKSELRSVPLKSRLMKGASKEHLMFETTSGSSGEPFDIYTTSFEALLQTVKGLRMMMQYGYKPWYHTTQVWREITEPKTSLIQKLGLFRRDIVSIMEPVDEQIQRILRNRSEVLYATRSTLQILADAFRDRQVICNPRILISGSEVLDFECREQLERAYGVSPINLYGCNEIGNIASDCPQQHHLHLEQETVFLEIVDDEGCEVGPGEAGEVLVTGLFNYAMPFIRYRLNDLIRKPEDSHCRCGRKAPYVEEVLGRKDDILCLPNGRQLNWHFFYTYFRGYVFLHKYKIVQEEQDTIVFELQLKPGASADEARRTISKDMERHLKHDVKLQFRFVGRFPVERSGKFKVIENRMPR